MHMFRPFLQLLWPWHGVETQGYSHGQNRLVVDHLNKSTSDHGQLVMAIMQLLIFI